MHAAVDLPKFDLTYGSTRVAVEVLAWEVHPDQRVAIVKACSCVTVGTA